MKKISGWGGVPCKKISGWGEGEPPRCRVPIPATASPVAVRVWVCLSPCGCAVVGLAGTGGFLRCAFFCYTPLRESQSTFFPLLHPPPPLSSPAPGTCCPRQSVNPSVECQRLALMPAVTPSATSTYSHAKYFHKRSSFLLGKFVGLRQHLSPLFITRYSHPRFDTIPRFDVYYTYDESNKECHCRCCTECQREFQRRTRISERLSE